MRLGVVQSSPVFGDVERNFRRAEELLASSHADLWVLPELFASGYQFASQQEVSALAEPVPAGPVTRRLVTLSRDLHAHLVAGLAERWDGELYNTAVLVGPQGLVARYRKVHLFAAEKRWFSPGDLPFPVVDLGEARVGILICFDHLFPEAARTLALRGADLVLHPANLIIPDVGQLTMRVRAIENGVFTATANRVGIERRGDSTLRFTGRSQIVSPRGRLLARCSEELEEVRVVEVDPAEARDKHLNAENDLLTDRRPEWYAR